MNKLSAFSFSLVLVFLLAHNASSGDLSHVYSTGRMMEVDRCASAWLIKRHIDTEAEFVFFKDGELITKGTAFDTPDARFCRTHNLSTFEILMGHFKVQDPKVKLLAKAIHEVEINYWAGKKSVLANELTMKLNAIIRENKDPATCLELSFKIFDDTVRNFPEP